MIHPENDPHINELIEFVESTELVTVWCHGCGQKRMMNAAYAPYVQLSGIKSCRFCRED